MKCSPAQLELLRAALERCRAGEPVSLLVTGEAGVGKSSLLDELVQLAEGCTVIRAESLPSTAPVPYEVLEQLGVHIRDAGEELPSPTLVAQRVRDWLDSQLADGPVLLILDDAQWADEESVSALTAVMSRAVAERVLLCLATRPLGPDQHAGFQRWIDRPGRAVRLVLTGLDLDAALELIDEIRPGLSPELAEQLWTHVDGNPLYLRALAEEHSGDELASMTVLPAPAGFAATVEARMARLSDAAGDLAAAAAVLDAGWSTLRAVAATAGLSADAAARAADELLSCRLVSTRRTAAGDDLRLAHALTRSAIYQSLSLDTRRRLHSHAALVVSGVSAVFGHRLAAAAGHDDALAADLAVHAAHLRRLRNFAQAARFERLASTVTSDPTLREQVWLDSLFDALMAMDRAAVRAERTALDEATDLRRRDLVLAVFELWERRPHATVHLLQPWSGSGDDIVQYRIETMLGWALHLSDAPEADTRRALDRADALPVEDAVVARYLMLVRAQLTARHITDLDEIALLRALPTDPRLVPLPATTALAWRGTVMANVGQFSRAIDDLLEVTARMQHGRIEFSSGTFHAVLGRAQWFAGDWARARVTLRTAVELGDGYPHPLVVSSSALPAIGEGRLAEADEQLDLARDLLRQVPWREATDQLAVTEIIRAHAGEQFRGELFDRLRAQVIEVAAGGPGKGVIWLTHAALAAVWAREIGMADALATRIERPAGDAPWAPAMAAWVRGLAAEAVGDGKAALAHLSAATRSDLSTMPLYRAHVHADHARLMHLLQGAAAARRSLDVAAEGYRSLGAFGYLDRLATVSRAEPPTAPAAAIQLSDRERDVLTLVVSGMSYAQVARELFITQSTVSYHLGNIYAKTDVKSRHQLTELARTEPAMLGLPGLAAVGS